jgi:PAS domain S-box-containing protein
VNSIALVFLVGTITLVAACVAAYIFFARQARAHSLRLRYERGKLKNEREARLIAEAAFALKDRLYRILFAHTTDMVFMFGLTDDGLPGHFSEVNVMACETLGYSRDKLLELSPLEIQVSDTTASLPGYTRSELVAMSDDEIMDRETAFAIRPVRQRVERILAEGHAEYTSTFLTHDGDHIPVEIYAHAFELEGRPMIICTAHDVAEREKAKHDLQESERRFEEFFSHSPVGVALYDGKGKLLNVNHACLKMFGAPDAEQFAKFNPFSNPFVPERMRRVLEQRDTAQFEMSIDFDKARTDGLYVTSRRGTGHLDVLMLNLGMDREYTPRGHLLQVQDITTRVQTKEALQRSERQLQQAQKMEALGTLAGGIAHDFNNILTPILGYTEIMLHSMDDNAPNVEFLKEIHKASYRAKELVQQILTFSRQREHENKPVHLIPIVKEVIKLQQSSLPNNVKINCVIKTNQDVVISNPTQIHQVMMNLCTNAGYAMKDTGGDLEVSLTDFMIGGRAQSEFPDLEPGRYLRIMVKDTGCGMDNATIERIFEPFFTTKPSGEGTGMGLAVVHGIIVGLKGALTVKSVVGEGTAFHVVLPVVEQQAAEEAGEAETLGDGSGRTVLFVDDENAVAQMAVKMLRALGYAPAIATDGEEALSMLKQSPQIYDLVITDLSMPGIGGRELALAVKELRPELPVILCTGFNQQYTEAEALREGFADMIQKPIIMRQLADAIAAALDRAG